MRRLLPLLVLGGSALLLSACATAAPTVDLDAAQEWLEGVQDAESDGPGAAGIAAMQVGPDGSASGSGTDQGVRLDFDNATTLTRADARCFGGETVDVTITTFAEGDATALSLTETIPCDEAPHEIKLGATGATAVLVDGTTDSPTYLHVTILQEMTVER